MESLQEYEKGLETTRNCSQLDFTNNTCFAFSKGEFEAVIWIKTSIASLSVVACSLAVLLIVFLGVYKKFAHRLTLYLNMAALVYSLVFALQVIPVENHCGYVVVRIEKLCTALGFLVEYSAWVMLLSMGWITLHLFLLGVFHKHLKSWRYEMVGLILVLVCPLLFAVVPLIDFKNGSMYGLAGTWCWIKIADENCHPHIDGKVEQFLLWYIPLIFLVLANFLAMVIMVVVLYKRMRVEPHGMTALQQKYEKVLRESIPLLFFPVFFNIICCLAFANRVYYVVTENTNFALWMAHAMVDLSLPLFISLTFLLHPHTRRKLLKVVKTRWKRDSLNSHTDLVAPKKDLCLTSEETTLIIEPTKDTWNYQSFTDGRTLKT